MVRLLDPPSLGLFLAERHLSPMPLRCCGLTRSTWKGSDETEILAIFVREEFRDRQQRVRIDEAHTPSDLFRTTNLQALSRFDSVHELRGVKQALERSSIQPGYPAR